MTGRSYEGGKASVAASACIISYALLVYLSTIGSWLRGEETSIIGITILLRKRLIIGTTTRFDIYAQEPF